jgi:RNA polymerase sigma-70 factor, ECF subfamily
MDADASAVVVAWQRGDEAAVRALFEEHYPRAVRLGALSGLTQHEAEDCAQAAFVRAFERRRQLRDPAAFPLWFHRIVTSQILTLLRHRGRSGEVDLDAAGDLAEDWQRGRIPRPDESAVASEQRERLWRNVQALPPRFRVAVEIPRASLSRGPDSTTLSGPWRIQFTMTYHQQDRRIITLPPADDPNQSIEGAPSP